MNALRVILQQLGAHKDALLVLAAFSGSVAAMCAAFVGFWQTNRTLKLNRDIATLQVRANISVNYRQAWIATYREDVGRLLSWLASIHLPGTAPGSKERQDQLLQLQYHQARIQLLPRDEHDVEGGVNIIIKDAIHEASLLMAIPLAERDHSKMEDLTSRIVRGCRIIVADEEARFKRLE